MIEKPQRRKLSFLFWAIFITLVLTALLLSTDKLPLSDDLGAYHYPFRVIYAESLKQGKIWEWNRAVFCGYDVHGEGQLGGDHPLHRLMYQFLPVNVAFIMEWSAPYPLFCLGMFWWLRRWRLGREAAFMSALTLTLSGYMVQRNVHMNATQVIAHLPWLLGLQWLVLRRIRQQQPWHKLTWPLLGIALLTGSQLLLGYPQYVLYSVLIEGVHALALCSLLGQRTTLKACTNPFDKETTDHFANDEPTSQTRLAKKWPRFLCALTVAKIVALFLGASQLLASLDYLRLSERANWSGEEALYGSWHPLNLLQLVAPYALENQVYGGDNKHELSAYVGTLALVMMLYGVFSKPKKPTMRALRSLGICLCLLGFSLAIGEFGPFKHLLPMMPVFNRFRLPCRATLIMLFGIVLLGAIGWQRLRVVSRTLMQETFDLKKLMVLLKPLNNVLSAVSMIVLVALAIYFFKVNPSHSYTCLIYLSIVIPVTCCFTFTRLFNRQIAGALCLIIVIESAYYNSQVLSFSHPKYYNDKSFKFNIYNERSSNEDLLITGNRFSLSHAHIGGYAGVKPGKIMRYRYISGNHKNDIIAIENPNTPISESEIGANCFRKVYGGMHLSKTIPAIPKDQVYPVDKPFLVAQYLRAASWFPAMLRVNFLQTAVTDAATNLPGIKQLQSADEPAIVSESVLLTAQPTLTDPGDMHYTIQTDRPALLVTTESYHHGWQATVDGQPVTPVRVNGDFLGVPVPANAQSVECRFVSKIHQLGRVISGCAVALCGGIALLTICRRKS